MRQQYGGPKLPVELRSQFGGDPAHRTRGSSARNGPPNRKDRRKADREHKKTLRVQPRKPLPPPQPQSQARLRRAPDSPGTPDESDVNWDDSDTSDAAPTPAPTPAQPKPILKKRPLPADEPAPLPVVVPRAVRDKLAQDDKEIAALEKRLGVRGKKKSQADDGLDDIFGDLGGDFSDDDGDDVLEAHTSKRKRAGDDDWLASKRRKALGLASRTSRSDEGGQDEDDAQEGDESDEDDELDSVDLASGSDDDDGDDDLNLDLDTDDGGDSDNDLLENSDGLESEDEEDDQDTATTQPRVRENPYIAPVAPGAPGAQPTKYVPPALRAPPASDAEALLRLKRQIQGLINRLSEANILSILRDVEKIYQDNPRGYVNSTLIDLLIGMLSDPSALLDTFLILHAGFIAAIYKVVGSDFGAQIVERIVSEFDQHYQPNKNGAGKHTTNLMSVVAELYTFQVIGSNIVFDYIRFFLDELSEINTELLLRIVRAAGPQLRQDDPSALKDIVVLLQKSVAKVGQQNLPVRTKFMIETIDDLKNNKMKTGLAASSMAREHTTRMKKQLGTLATRNLKATEPLRVGLKDIKDTDKKGKWWLVGASWRNESSSNEPSTGNRNTDFGIKQHGIVHDDEEEEGGEVDLVQLAREQRMNTDVRRAIFVSIMSAGDFQDAQVRLNKLNLKRSQEVEIPKVIIHCAGSEKTYNPYYTVLARKVCSDHRTRKSFEFALWDIFKSLGENQDGGEYSEDEEEEEGAKDVSLRKLVNQGKLYGTLIAKRVLSMTCLKNLNFPYLQSRTKTFVEVLLVTVILETQKGSKGIRKETPLLQTFVEVDQAPEMVAGLQFFLKKVVSKTDIVDKEEKETVRWACKPVMQVLNRVLAASTIEGE